MSWPHLEVHFDEKAVLYFLKKPTGGYATIDLGVMRVICYKELVAM